MINLKCVLSDTLTHIHSSRFNYAAVYYYDKCFDHRIDTKNKWRFC